MNLIYITLIIYLSARIDANHLNRNHYIYKHLSRWMLRAVIVIAISNTVLELIGCTLFFIATFDQVLNYLRNRELLYLGTVAKWDLFFKKYPLLYIIIKIVSLFSGIYLLIHEMRMPSLFIDIQNYLN